MKTVGGKTFVGSSPTVSARCSFSSMERITGFDPVDEGSSPSNCTKRCPVDGIGIRVGLRNRILGVQISCWAPKIYRYIKGLLETFNVAVA